ncbi:MAG TPA: FAD-dependent oxidoreductase, partial [Bacteroidia bacterium]|nr:FAD-dependent oxidoreductase [Bacteroidia bacterium]
MAETTLPYMLEFFTGTEKLFGCKLLYTSKIARVFANENEEVLWKKRSVNELTDLIENKTYVPGNEFSFLKNKYAFVKQGGFVDVPAFLNKTKKYLQENTSLAEETFDHSGLSITENEVSYKDITAGKIIFCQGYLTHNNPYFNRVKLKPAKGEVLEIYCEELKINSVLNKDIFILPLPEKNCFKVGATYNWTDLNDTPGEEAKNYLLEKLNHLIPYPFKVLKQLGGVRPAATDRRPVMGFHPQHNKMGIFNGFGTKSVMLAPYFAKHFCSFMENKTELLHEVNVNRFF